jgi:Na+/H+ antiporter NhaA
MSLFIAGLAFEGTGLLAEAKMGILAASLASALAGWAVLWGSNRSPEGPNG